jgi:hypothetical protein
MNIGSGAISTVTARICGLGRRSFQRSRWAIPHRYGCGCSRGASFTLFMSDVDSCEERADTLERDGAH